MKIEPVYPPFNKGALSSVLMKVNFFVTFTVFSSKHSLNVNLFYSILFYFYCHSGQFTTM